MISNYYVDPNWNLLILNQSPVQIIRYIPPNHWDLFHFTKLLCRPQLKPLDFLNQFSVQIIRHIDLPQSIEAFFILPIYNVDPNYSLLDFNQSPFQIIR